MCKRLPAVLLLCCLINLASAEDPVYFADETLKAAVEDALWVSDPTPTDMLGLTSLTVGSSKISSMTGLEYATNLTSLELPCNWITNITVASNLVNLRRFVLNNNTISDLTPLSGLTQLEHIDMHDNNRISDLTPLSGLTRLRTLILRGNSISNVGTLGGLSDLRSVHLERNQISDIAPLAQLTNLTSLDLRNNPLNGDAYSTYIPQILENNPGVSLTYPASPSRFILSSTAGGSIVAPGEGEFDYSGIGSITIEAQADPCFVFVSFSGTVCTGQNPLPISVDQDHNIRANFMSTRNTLWVDDNAPNDIGPGNPAIGDPLEDGTQDHPFDSIQEAIDVAPEGACVFVRHGVYNENISLGGKNILLTGIDPNDPNNQSYPVIDGSYKAPVVSFTGGEDPNCTLSGFVLTRGKSWSAGAILCSRSSPTIANCLIVGNRSTHVEGAAVYCTDSNVTFINCTIAHNYGGAHGTALRVVDGCVLVSNSILWGNAPTEISTEDPNALSIAYSNVAGGWDGTNNINSDPLFALPGYWTDSISGAPVASSTLNAVWTAGDYHLKSQIARWDPEIRDWVQDDLTSPCIDAGDPLQPVDRETPSTGLTINMGVYGGTAQASDGN